MRRLLRPTNTHDASIAASLKAIAGFAIFMGSLGLLTACGDDDDSETIDPAPANGGMSYTEQGWSTQTDSVTGREFRCLYRYESHGYGAGAALFCYEPAEGELP